MPLSFLNIYHCVPIQVVNGSGKTGIVSWFMDRSGVAMGLNLLVRSDSCGEALVDKASIFPEMSSQNHDHQYKQGLPEPLSLIRHCILKGKCRKIPFVCQLFFIHKMLRRCVMVERMLFR